MIRNFAKLLPYCVVMWFTKKFGADMLNDTTFMKDKLFGWRIDKGEWIVWNKDNYDRMTENERKSKEKKLDKNFHKILRKISTDYALNQELRKYYEDIIRQEKEEQMYN